MPAPKNAQKPPKKTKEELEAAAAAAVSLVEAERQAALIAAEQQRQREERELAAKLEAERCARAEELARLQTEFITEGGKLLVLPQEGGPPLAQAAALHSFIAAAQSEDELLLSAVDEGLISLLAPPGGVGPPGSAQGGQGLESALSPATGTPSATGAATRFSGDLGTTSTGGILGASGLGAGRLLHHRANSTRNGLDATSGKGGGEREAPRQLLRDTASSALPHHRGHAGGAPHAAAAGPVPPLAPALEACTRLASFADGLESSAVPDAVQAVQQAACGAIQGYSGAARDRIAARLDALSAAALQQAAAYATETKDGNMELSLSGVFYADAGGAAAVDGGQCGPSVRVAAHAEPDEGRRVVGEVLLWANLGPVKATRTKTIRSPPLPVPFGQDTVRLRPQGAAAPGMCGPDRARVVTPASQARGPIDASGGGATGLASPSTTANGEGAAGVSFRPGNSSIGSRPPSRPGAAGQNGGGSDSAAHPAPTRQQSQLTSTTSICFAAESDGAGGATGAAASHNSQHGAAAAGTAGGTDAHTSTLTVELHKAVASLPAGLRVIVTEYDHVAEGAALEVRRAREAALAAAGPVRRHLTRGDSIASAGGGHTTTNNAAGAAGAAAGAPPNPAAVLLAATAGESGGAAGPGGRGPASAPRSGAPRLNGTMRGGPGRGSTLLLSASSPSDGGDPGAEGSSSGGGSGERSSGLHPVGPVITVELLSLPAAPVVVKGLSMFRVTSQAPPHTVTRQPHPAAGQGGTAAAQAVKIKVRIAAGIIVPSPPVVARWQLGEDPAHPGGEGADPLLLGAAAATAHCPRDYVVVGDPTPPQRTPANGQWVADALVSDASFDPHSRVLSFSTMAMGAHALVQPRHADLPYAVEWTLRPAALRLQASLRAAAQVREHRREKAEHRPTRYGGGERPSPSGSGGSDGVDATGEPPASSSGIDSRAGAEVEDRLVGEDSLEGAEGGENEGGTAGVSRMLEAAVPGREPQQEGGDCSADAVAAYSAAPRTLAECVPAAAELRLRTPRMEIVIHIEGGVCALLEPQIPELQHLLLPTVQTGETGAAATQPCGGCRGTSGGSAVWGSPVAAAAAAADANGAWMTPGRLLFALQRAGVCLMPQDHDASALNAERLEADEAAAAARRAAAANVGGAGAEPREARQGAPHASRQALAGEMTLGAADGGSNGGGGTAASTAGSGRAGDAAGKGFQLTVSGVPVSVPIVPRGAALESAAYSQIARLASSFTFAGSHWNALGGGLAPRVLSCTGEAAPAEQHVVLRAHESVAPLPTGTSPSVLSALAKTGAPSDDGVPWRTVEMISDAGAPGGVRVGLVADNEPDARAAWAAARVTSVSVVQSSSSGAGAGEGDPVSGDAAARAGTTTSAVAAAVPFGGLPSRKGSVGSDFGPAAAEQAAEASALEGSSSGGGGAAAASEEAGRLIGSFSGILEAGTVTHASLLRVLQGRSSQEAVDAAVTADPRFVATAERLLALLRPLSFAQ